MKRSLLIAVLLCTAAPVLAADADAGLAAVQDLGRLNGQALACSQMATSSQAKALMIRHAPKTRRYGEVFEEATNSAFLTQGKDQDSCPQPAEFAGKLGELGARLQAAFAAAQ